MKRKRPVTDNDDELENKELDEGENISKKNEEKTTSSDRKALEKILFGEVNMKLL